MATHAGHFPLREALAPGNLLEDQPNEFAARATYTPTRTYGDQDHKAATVLQAAWRGYSVRKAQSKPSIKDENSISESFLPKFDSKYILKYIDKRKKQSAAFYASKKLAQKVPHYYGEVIEPENGYQEKHHKAVIKLQALLRGHITRSQLHSETQTKKETKVKLFKPPEGGYQDAHQSAATKIQAIFRGYKTRCELESQAERREADQIGFKEALRDPRNCFSTTHGLDIPIDGAWEYIDGPDAKQVFASRNPKGFALKQQYVRKLNFMQRENTELYETLRIQRQEIAHLAMEIDKLNTELEQAFEQTEATLELQQEQTRLSEVLQRYEQLLTEKENQYTQELERLSTTYQENTDNLKREHQQTLQRALTEYQNVLRAKDKLISDSQQALETAQTEYENTLNAKNETIQEHLATIAEYEANQQVQAKNNRFKTRLAITTLVALNVLTYATVAYTMLNKAEKGWYERTGEFLGFI